MATEGGFSIAATTSTISSRTPPSRRRPSCSGTARCPSARSSTPSGRPWRRQRRLPPKVLALLRSLPRKSDSMDVLRTAVSTLGMLRSRCRRQLPGGQPAEGRPHPGAGADAGRRVEPDPEGQGARSRPNPRLSLAGNLLYMLLGPEAERPRREGDGHRADPPCRPRAERLHVRGAGHGGDPVRHVLGRGVGDRRAQGPASRGRERRRHADAARDRRRRPRGDVDQERARAEEADHGVRASRLPHRGPAGDPPPAPVRSSSGGRPATSSGSSCPASSSAW